MPKGYKTLSIKEETWDYAQALFNKQSNRNVSFSSWVSEFLQFSVQRELFFEYMRTGLVVIDYETDEIKEVDKNAEEITKLTVVDKNKKEFIEVTLDPFSQRVDDESGFYCEKCKSRRCQHAFFIASTPKGINQATKLPSAFQDYLQNFLKENKKE